MQGQAGSLSNDDFDAAVSGLLDRLGAHEQTVEADAGTGRQRPSSGSGPQAATAAPFVAALEESFKDIRACVLEKLKGYQETVEWSLPAGARARVAPGLLARVYRGGRNYEQYVSDQIKRRGLESNHLGSEWMMLAILIDRAVVEGGQAWINLKSTEMALRRLYGIERALENVRCEADWRQPKGGQKGWRTKVQYHVLEQIDVGGLDKDGIGIEAVDREVRERLKEKALLSKALGQLHEAPSGGD